MVAVIELRPSAATSNSVRPAKMTAFDSALEKMIQYLKYCPNRRGKAAFTNANDNDNENWTLKKNRTNG